MNFGIGDVVICIDTMLQPDDGPNQLVLGAEYVIRDAHHCSLQSHVDVGLWVAPPGIEFECKGCKAPLNNCDLRSSRFIKAPRARANQRVGDEVTA